MKLYCYKENKYFTVGNWYNLTQLSKMKKVKSDAGFYHSYYNVKQYFLTKELLREQKLKRILNNI